MNVSTRNCGSDSKMDLGTDLDEEFYGGLADKFDNWLSGVVVLLVIRLDFKVLDCCLTE